MKKLISLSIISLLFISCTSDDSPTDLIDEGKPLFKMIQTRFENGKVHEIIEFTYKNGKPLKSSFYDPENELMGYTDWLYNDKKLLAATKYYKPNGTQQYQSILTYDSNDRIIKVEQTENESNYRNVYEYIHNNDNTITSNAGYGTDIFTKTYHINSDGLIYKETVKGKTTIEVIYHGNNPTSVISNSGTSTFTYDENNLRKGVFLNQLKTTFGENKINPILWGYYLENQVGSSSDKYQIKQIFPNGHIEEYNYIFDNDGYPTSMKRHYNDELTDEVEYFYE